VISLSTTKLRHELFAPTAPIYGDGGALATAEWRDVARLQNRAARDLGTLHPAVSQWWTDGECYVLAGGGGAAYTTVCKWRVPILTDAHDKMRVSIRCPLIANKGLWGATYPAGQNVRFTSIKSRASAGAGEVIISPSGTAWEWLDSPGAALGANDLDLDTAGTYEEIHMDLVGTSATSTEGPIVFGCKLEYVRPTIVAKLTEPNTSEVFDPLHDEEFAAGMPVAADLARILVQNADHLRERRSVVLNWSACDGSEADALRRQGMGGLIPIHPEGRTLTVHVRGIRNGSGTASVYVGHSSRMPARPTYLGPGRGWLADPMLYDLEPGDGIARLDFSSGTESWQVATFDLDRLRDSLRVGLGEDERWSHPPGPYDMGGLFLLHADRLTGVSPSVDIRSISAWGA